MQATQPNSGTTQATTDGDIKRYKVSEQFSDLEVTLEVDHSILTTERAKLINEFWSNHEWRAAEEEGDHVRAVIRMAGADIARLMLERGQGASFGTNNTELGKIWSEKFRDEEGWGSEDGTPFSRCGIRVIAASVEVPGFDEFQVEEVQS
ncbi:MAG: DUF2528 family protein [Pseudomonas neustonica]